MSPFPKRTRNKYGSKRVGGYGSKLESAVFDILQLREYAGEIRILKKQDNLSLGDAGVRYIADFKCEETRTGTAFWVEAKGFEGPRWPTIKRAWKLVGPGKLEIWKGTYRDPKLVETLTPKPHQTNIIQTSSALGPWIVDLCEKCRQIVLSHFKQ